MKNILDTQIKEQCKQLLTEFDKLEGESRQREFNKMAIASMIIKQVIESVQEIGTDRFKEILVKDDFVADTFRRIGIYNEIGVELGYTVRIDDDNAKNAR